MAGFIATLTSLEEPSDEPEFYCLSLAKGSWVETGRVVFTLLRAELEEGSTHWNTHPSPTAPGRMSELLSLIIY